MNMVDFNAIKLDRDKRDSGIEIHEVSNQEIAITGIAVKLPQANSTDRFWEILQNGVDCIRPLPETRRKDVFDLLRLQNIPAETVSFGEGAYLDEIDRFDYRFFGLSPKEAALTDPNQRLFLETAWEAIENAGYGGDRLIGSRTGVYVGFSSDSEYKRMIAAADAEALSMAVPGNIKPIVASRLSYLLDLRGPSLIVDTTCSSSLMAIHLACKAIRNGECDLAIVGGVQVHLIPIRQAFIGVESSDGRAKTFDDRSDGTGTGEGVIAMLLKPLWKAQQDRDLIYAVIKGSAANNDGASIGITAPNANAQEDVIGNAWRDAGVKAETITYIEAHGTGTKLGDPIEIDGIQRAFRRHTDRKQFCGIGTVKTNIGHLDNTAGIAGLLKAVLALRYRQLPPSLHFTYPNRRIPFDNSPVYVIDRLTAWETDSNPRRCGVSSFGLSGTNCHIILEEAPSKSPAEIDTLPRLMTISAKSRNALQAFIDRYRNYLDRTGESLGLGDLCYTAATGRDHHTCRVALIVTDIKDLRAKLAELNIRSDSGRADPAIHFGEHRIVSEPGAGEPGELNPARQRELSAQAERLAADFIRSGKTDRELLTRIAHLYVQGAVLDWTRLYRDEPRRRVEAPTYPFERSRCWLDIKPKPDRELRPAQPTGHPLLERCLVKSMGLEIYATTFQVDKHWVLNEHIIDGQNVLVGTAHLEMALEACIKHFPAGVLLREVQFVTPLVLQPGDSVEAQVILKFESDAVRFVIASQPPSSQPGQRNEWIRHIEGKASALDGEAPAVIDIAAIKRKYQTGLIRPDLDEYNGSTVFQFGPRWNNLRAMYVGDRELVSDLEMPDRFTAELPQYPLHPALLDNALATIPLLNRLLPERDDRTIFLPFSYQSVRFYRPLPAVFHSYVRLKETGSANPDLVSFDVRMVDEAGRALVEIDDYSLIKTQKSKLHTVDIVKGNPFYQIGWRPGLLEHASAAPGGTVLILAGERYPVKAELIRELTAAGRQAVLVEFGPEYAKTGAYAYTIKGEPEDYRRVVEELRQANLSQVLHLASLGRAGTEISAAVQLEQCLNTGVQSLFHLSQAILDAGLRQTVEFLLIGESVHPVTAAENRLSPEPAALFGLGKVLEREYPNLRCRAIDSDESISTKDFVAELGASEASYLVAYRDGRRYVEELRPARSDIPVQAIPLDANGVYLITGGAGGLGLEIARSLAGRGTIHLALLNRTQVPKRAEWEAILAAGTDRKTIRTIQAIQGIEAGGSQVICVQADVASVTELGAALERLRHEFGRINGIIHCAGVAGDGFIIRKTAERFQEVLRPKIQGTWLLDRLTRADRPDFMVLFSSNNTLVGVPGQGDYTAANAYLDAFAAFRNSLGSRTLTINWPGWKDVGMARDHGVNLDGLMKLMPTAEALRAFEAAMDLATDRLIVGEFNWNGLDRGVLAGARLQLAPEILQGFRSPRIETGAFVKALPEVRLSGKAAHAYSQTERNVAGVWSEVLGYEELDVNSSFFEIGGDSILITKVHAKLEAFYPGKVQIGDLFAFPTIAKLARFIAGESRQTDESGGQIPSGKNDSGREDEIMRILDQIEQGKLSVEAGNEIIRRLGSRKK